MVPLESNSQKRVRDRTGTTPARTVPKIRRLSCAGAYQGAEGAAGAVADPQSIRATASGNADATAHRRHSAQAREQEKSGRGPSLSPRRSPANVMANHFGRRSTCPGMFCFLLGYFRSGIVTEEHDTFFQSSTKTSCMYVMNQSVGLQHTARQQ